MELNTADRIARRANDEITLTRKEYILLELLMRRAGQVVTRNQLREAGWSYDSEVSDSSVDFYIHSLRSKIDTKGHSSLIRTVRSLGYTLAASK